MTPAPSLLFLPDISGFTYFVHETELEHSQYIISGLLETLVTANELAMTVAEIEGDAVLFYKENQVPAPAQVVAQAQRMYYAFHGWVREFVRVSRCGCPACQSVTKLTLKVVAHAGPLGFTTVQQQRKPFGAAVVVVHRLLKNAIPSHEYVLLTDALLTGAAPPALQITAPHSVAFYEGVGEVGYVHLLLSSSFTAGSGQPN